MDDNMRDILHCEEQLKSTLYCDDKEKLRRKLTLLQREYLRTVQRLQRAERLDAVQKHVRSRITQQNHKDERDPEMTSNNFRNPQSLILKNGTAPDVPQCQGRTKGLADSNSSKRSQVIRFLLPSDAACPQTPDASHDVARGHRPSSAMRLRSRRSRLRWERRSAEAEKMTDNSEEGEEQSEMIKTTGIEGEKEEIKSKETEVVIESEELFSASESESPSLLLTHWNTHANTETGDIEEKEICAYEEQREKESELSASLPLITAVHTEERVKDCTPNGRIKATEARDDGENCGGENKVKLCEKKNKKDTEQYEAEKMESEKRHVNPIEIKEEKSGVERNGKSVGLLDSCTLVEGLLFPVEYYVRTTRRMTFSQSQPDMQAVILSQLSMGRRRGRGRGSSRGLNRNTQTKRSDQQSQTDLSSLATTSANPPKASHVQAADVSAELTSNGQSSSEISNPISDSQTNITSRSRRGRRRKRGRGRSQTPRTSITLDTNHLGLGQIPDSPPPTSTPVSPCLSLYSTNGPTSCLTSQEAVPVSNDPLPASNHSTATRLSSGINEAQSDPASGHLEKVYPIFLKSNVSNNRSTQMSRNTASWQSLHLPSSPTAQTCLRPVPFQSLGSLISNLMNFDIQQDFHLPDDQFASLKLHKLRQVAMESEVESFTSPYNTRNRKRRSDSCCTGSSDPLTPLPLPFSLTPTITDSPCFTEDKQATLQSVELQNLSVDHKLASQSLAEESSYQPDTTETPGEQHTDSVSSKMHEAVTLNSCNKSSVSTSITDRPADKVNVIGHIHLLDELKIKQDTDCIDVVDPLEDQRSKNHRTEHKIITKTLKETPEEVSYNCTAVEMCNDPEAPGDPAVKHLNVKSAAEDSKGHSELALSLIRDKSVDTKHPEHHSVHSQLLLSPPLASAPCPFITPHLPSSAHLSSPTLPSLGLTPHPAFPLTSSPSAPSLTLPPPHSPSIQALSPPVLSPCPSLTSLPSSLPRASPSSQNQSSLDQYHRIEPPPCPPPSKIQSQGSDGLVSQAIQDTAKEHMLSHTHTLKAPAGSCLVDACCLPAHSGGVCVAAAGKWAVCLWSHISSSDWSLIHTWTFNEPVISVFPVPDAAELVCVTLGQLEIREVRMLSCSSFSQVLLYEGVVQAVVGVSKARVVTSSHSETSSTLQVFNLSGNNSMPTSQHLVSPGVCIGALASVDGLCDALIGTDECGHLFVWNVKTGQLLQRVLFRNDLSHTACLRGYSYGGVLFVLLQHQLLSSLEEAQKEAKAKDCMFSEEEKEVEKKKIAFFSLVAVNPLSGKSVLATELYPPKAWSGRLCEADVNSSSVVGVSQSGSVCVWELGRQMDPRMVWAPESEGWQLARWGGRDVLVTGHHNGDVTLHRYSQNSPND